MSFKEIQGAQQNQNVDLTAKIIEIRGVGKTANGKMKTTCVVSDGVEMHNVNFFNSNGIDPNLLDLDIPMRLSWFIHGPDSPAAGKVGYSGFVRDREISPQQLAPQPQQASARQAFPRQTTGGYPNVNAQGDKEACIVRQCAGKVAVQMCGVGPSVETFFDYVVPINEWMLTGKVPGAAPAFNPNPPEDNWDEHQDEIPF
ncbi:MAG: hypothetical protein GY832_11770 [Chloroflexi bacterium]|nr:hypothetical protein [Chloroflexota bacterium]